MTEQLEEPTSSTPAQRTIRIPELALVVLIGPSGCGKSTFARTHLAKFETLSSDFCRGLVSNDENDQSATSAAFEALHYLAGDASAYTHPAGLERSRIAGNESMSSALNRDNERFGTLPSCVHPAARTAFAPLRVTM